MWWLGLVRSTLLFAQFLTALMHILAQHQRANYKGSREESVLVNTTYCMMTITSTAGKVKGQAIRPSFNVWQTTYPDIVSSYRTYLSLLGSLQYALYWLRNAIPRAKSKQQVVTSGQLCRYPRL